MSAESAIAAVDDSGANTASEVRTALTSVLTRADKLGASVYQSSAHSVSASTWTTVQMDAEYFDDESYHDNATNNTRLTVPSAGLYLFGGGARVVNTTARSITRLTVNGTAIAPQAENHGSGYLGDVVVALQMLSASDYVEVQMYHNSSGARDTLPEGCGLWIVRLAG